MTDFYVGYHDPSPPRVRRFQRRFAAASLVIAGAAAVVIASGQRQLPAAVFEFGTIRSFEGFVVADPYPSLIVPRGPVNSRFLLVGPGKSGADALVEAVAGGWATMDGTLAYRDGQSVIQVEPGSVARAGGALPPSIAEAVLGERSMEGEIVGAKCYLGVMNPGSGIAHRACADLCIRGGIPPLLMVRHEDGATEGIILAGPDGEALGEELSGLIATPVGVTGNLVRKGATTVLHVDPAEIRRLH
ncbi:MAG: hypothetical protein OXE96_09815 [Gemmatimonadetes bacterium]|nr:hypothetical protein [Gemmatimonadota bacterium]